ncbi:MAG TPA: PilT/PilU family type 4a pilus ATPase [Candidatus Woesebacteria bacterium]|nr:PilT/PilU family type 4a pilus ATPase [Candidatus Woesebacteria bacterium]
MDITELFKVAAEKKASDLHIITGYYPTIRVNDKLIQLKTEKVLTAEDVKLMLYKILTSEQKDEFETNKEIDFSHEWEEFRYRVNYYHVRGAIAAAFRVIPQKIPTIEELSLPASLHKFAQMREGLVLLTGPTGEGKSTTIASILNEVNLNQEKHIITIEDPIEYIYPQGKSIISQRELHGDTHSWSKALRSVLREDPDVVLIGEMRDFDTIQAAMTIAETGHLVFSTLHTGSTPDAINRIVDVFPANQQNQIRHQLASVLKGVVSQRLVPHISGTSRVPALEILLNTTAVSSLIREGKVYMIDNVLQTAEDQEMIIFEKYLAMLYKQNSISREAAQSYALRENEVKKFVT